MIERQPFRLEGFDRIVFSRQRGAKITRVGNDRVAIPGLFDQERHHARQRAPYLGNGTLRSSALPP